MTHSDMYTVCARVICTPKLWSDPVPAHSVCRGLAWLTSGSEEGKGCELRDAGQSSVLRSGGREMWRSQHNS